MIDFTNGSIVKLSDTGAFTMQQQAAALFVPGEQFVREFKGIRDYVVFTDRRLIVANVQGLTGKKVDFTSLPYDSIQAFSVETSGHLDLDSELEMYFSGLGKVKLEFAGKTDVVAMARFIGSRVL